MDMDKQVLAREHRGAFRLSISLALYFTSAFFTKWDVKKVGKYKKKQKKRPNVLMRPSFPPPFSCIELTSENTPLYTCH